MENDTVLCELLEDVKVLLATDYAERFKQGRDFNVFEVEGVLSDEVRVCRLLKELLDPEGSHGQGHLFLKLFMQEVIQCNDFDETAYEGAAVTREEVIDNSRRIDLVIKIVGKIYPIEVKIYAKDQEAQCYDYYEYAKEKSKDSQVIIYYLTLDGHEPSDFSLKSKDKNEMLAEDRYKCISFDKHIMNWITRCINSTELEQIYPVREILIQFRDAIKMLTGKEKGKIYMKIKEKINTSKEYFSAALQIKNALPDVMADKMIEVFDAIRDHMKEKSYDKYYDHETYKSDAVEYYNQKRHMIWPSLSYNVPVSDEALKGKIALIFEIGWDGLLYFGITPWDENKKSNDCEKTNGAAEYVKNHLKPLENVSVSKCWYWYKYIEEDIDFRISNEKYRQLYDGDKFAEIMKNIFFEIDGAIEKIYNNTKN